MEKEILYKFFEGTISPAEKQQVKAWVEISTENRAQFMREREFFDAVILSDRLHKETIGQPAGKRSPVRRLMVELSKIAAVAAVLFVAAHFWYTKQMDERLSQYQAGTHTISVPAGQRASLKLPDGTTVWLNARTEMSYPSFFTGNTRDVQLNGEAYFEVEHDAGKPFVVHTDKYDIEVLGTSFNVDAYSDSKGFETALMEGEVIVTSPDSPRRIRLTPGYKAIENNGILTPSVIDDYDIYRWREGLICFKDISFTELMKKFEKCYGIEIVVENQKVANRIFNGKFRISDGIDYALRVLQKEGQYTFERDSEDTTVFIK